MTLATDLIAQVQGHLATSGQNLPLCYVDPVTGERCPVVVRHRIAREAGNPFVYLELVPLRPVAVVE
jgi:hypothetical protein